MTRQRDGSGMTSQRTRDRLVRRLEVEGIRESRTLEAMRHVPRHLFVDEALASRAYEDMALPIGHGQTISQPFVVARMTEVLVAGREVSKVLEIGTGCGYQSAVLARIVGTVFTIERIETWCGALGSDSRAWASTMSACVMGTVTQGGRARRRSTASSSPRRRLTSLRRWSSNSPPEDDWSRRSAARVIRRWCC